MTTTRKAAQLNGDTHYHGRKCKKTNHGTLRYTSSGTCFDCLAERARSQEKKEYDKRYFQENTDKIRERTRRYNEKNREEVYARQARWQAANQEKVKAIKSSYKARRRQQESGGDSTKEISIWVKSVAKVCHWCGKKCAKEYHIDHYHPLSKGGKHVVSNLVIACKTCNLRKNAKDPYDFATSVGRLF